MEGEGVLGGLPERENEAEPTDGGMADLVRAEWLAFVILTIVEGKLRGSCFAMLCKGSANPC